jgi:hypothetical protein
MVPESAMVSNLFSCVGCQENDVMLFAVPGCTLRSSTEGSTSSLLTTVYWISCKCTALLSLNKDPRRLCLQNRRRKKLDLPANSAQIFLQYFSTALIIQHQLEGWFWMVRRKDCWMKQLWLILRNYLTTFSEWLKVTPPTHTHARARTHAHTHACARAHINKRQ